MRSLPLQAEIWRNVLLRCQTNKHWAIDLDVDVAVVSRWTTGERPTGLDDLARAHLALRSQGRTEAAEALRDRVLEAFPSEDTPGAPASPLMVLGGLHASSSAVVCELVAAAADGRVDDDERDRIACALDALQAELDRARRALASVRAA